MAIVVVVLAFVVGVGLVLALAHVGSKVPAMMMRRKLDSRLQELTQSDQPEAESTAALLKTLNSGPLPGLDRAFGQTARGSALAGWIDQSGAKVSLS